MSSPIKPWRKFLIQDWDRYFEAPPTLRAVLMALIFNAGFLTVFLLRLAKVLRERRWKLLSRLTHRFNMVASACELSPQANVDAGLFLPHPYGVTIGHGCRVGKNVTLFQGVVLGARTVTIDGEESRAEYPRIGDGVVIYPHSLVYGSLLIGDNAVILGNSVVSRNVPANATYGGVPAREIRPKQDSTVLQMGDSQACSEAETEE